MKKTRYRKPVLKPRTFYATAYIIDKNGDRRTFLRALEADQRMHAEREAHFWASDNGLVLERVYVQLPIQRKKGVKERKPSEA